MTLATFLPVILVVHISLAIALLAPSLLLPFTTRSKSPGRISRRLLWLQSNGTLVIGGGLAVTGVLLVLTLGSQLLGQPDRRKRADARPSLRCGCADSA